MKKQIPPQIDNALGQLPAGLLNQSGSEFYTGKQAFHGTRPLYLLGLNPGGDPVGQAGSSVAAHITAFRECETPWSAYADDSWEGAPPGTWGMQPRILHMLERLALDPRQVPASNVVFARSRGEADLYGRKASLVDACWSVHEAVIETLEVRAIVCFGGTAGGWVRERIGAYELFDSFRETNARGWTSEAHRSVSGRVVVTVTHPGRADWRISAADPTEMVRRAIATLTP